MNINGIFTVDGIDVAIGDKVYLDPREKSFGEIIPKDEANQIMNSESKQNGIYTIGCIRSINTKSKLKDWKNSIFPKK